MGRPFLPGCVEVGVVRLPVSPGLIALPWWRLTAAAAPTALPGRVVLGLSRAHVLVTCALLGHRYPSVGFGTITGTPGAYPETGRTASGSE